MERSPDSYLLDKKQPHGVVKNFITHPGSPCDLGYESKSLGPSTVNNNYGYEHGPGFADQGKSPAQVDPFYPIKK